MPDAPSTDPETAAAPHTALAGLPAKRRTRRERGQVCIRQKKSAPPPRPGASSAVESTWFAKFTEEPEGHDGSAPAGGASTAMETRTKQQQPDSAPKAEVEEAEVPNKVQRREVVCQPQAPVAPGQAAKPAKVTSRSQKKSAKEAADPWQDPYRSAAATFWADFRKDCAEGPISSPLDMELPESAVGSPVHNRQQGSSSGFWPISSDRQPSLASPQKHAENIPPPPPPPKTEPHPQGTSPPPPPPLVKTLLPLGARMSADETSALSEQDSGASPGQLAPPGPPVVKTMARSPTIFLDSEKPAIMPSQALSSQLCDTPFDEHPETTPGARSGAGAATSEPAATTDGRKGPRPPPETMPPTPTFALGHEAAMSFGMLSEEAMPFAPDSLQPAAEAAEPPPPPPVPTILVKTIVNLHDADEPTESEPSPSSVVAEQRLPVGIGDSRVAVACAEDVFTKVDTKLHEAAEEDEEEEAPLPSEKSWAEDFESNVPRGRRPDMQAAPAAPPSSGTPSPLQADPDAAQHPLGQRARAAEEPLQTSKAGRKDHDAPAEASSPQAPKSPTTAVSAKSEVAKPVVVHQPVSTSAKRSPSSEDRVGASVAAGRRDVESSSSSGSSSSSEAASPALLKPFSPGLRQQENGQPSNAAPLQEEDSASAAGADQSQQTQVQEQQQKQASISQATESAAGAESAHGSPAGSKEAPAAESAQGSPASSKEAPASVAEVHLPPDRPRRQRVEGLPPVARASKRSSDAEVRKVYGQVATSSASPRLLDFIAFACDYLGFGLQEAKTLCLGEQVERGVDLATQISFESFKEMYAKLNPFMIANRKSETMVRKPGALAGQMLNLENLEDCQLMVCDVTGQIFADFCKNSKILLGPCESSVFIRDCEDCTFWLAAQQLRTNNCKRCTFYLFSKTEPIIETSEDLVIAPWCASYPSCKEQFEKAGFNIQRNLWNAVFDFSGRKDRANWKIPSLDTVEELHVHLDEAPGLVGEPADLEEGAKVTHAKLCAEPLQSEGSSGQSVANIPQTRPPPPPAPSNGAAAPKQWNWKDVLTA
eukprot:TRINITY_DN30310_c0_g1_i2.p1 TRINITY_DN30310_c0_g1~~TRINITY_DN30310_c0_g1_i2.p1  ORF type:complete len:1164 (+),score=250.16 TRINITY_DN30310_c0_g1_i2:345-3494(+)